VKRFATFFALLLSLAAAAPVYAGSLSSPNTPRFRIDVDNRSNDKVRVTVHAEQSYTVNAAAKSTAAMGLKTWNSNLVFEVACGGRDTRKNYPAPETKALIDVVIEPNCSWSITHR
jgi:hypothetical protein